MAEVKFPVSTVRMDRNREFTGRDDDLHHIHEVLTGTEDEDVVSKGQSDGKHLVGRKNGPACCVLHGLAGVGKTQIALEYTYRYGSEYDAMFWLEAEHDWTLTSTYVRISDQLGLLGPKTSEDDGGRRQTLAVQKAREWLQSTERKWLLVFDNAEDISDLNPYLPHETVIHGSILITMQKPTGLLPMKKIDIVPVKSLGRDDAGALMLKHIKVTPVDETEEELGRGLSDMVNGLPLAIAIIGSCIDQAGSNLLNIIGRLIASSDAWKASAASPVNQHEMNLETVLDIAITELSEDALRRICILGFLSPDHIPEEMFTPAMRNHSLGWLDSETYLLEVCHEQKVVQELLKRQLIREEFSVTGPYLAMHRTVQRRVLVHLSRKVAHRWAFFQQAFKLVRDVLPAESPFIVPSSDTWLRYHKYGAHILSLRAHCLWPDPPVELPVNFAQLLSDMGTYMWHAGKFPEGQEVLKTAVTIMDKNKLGDDHPLRANAYEMLGIMSSFEGVSERRHSMDLRYKSLEARKLYYDSMKPRCNVTRDDEIKRWTVESDVAYGLVQQEDFEPAAKIMERCLKKYQDWGPEDEYPYQYSQYYQILAVCQMAAGKSAESIKSITHCVDLLVKSSDIMHPMTQLMRFITGNLTWHAGESQKALEIMISVLEARRKVIGEFSQFTLESYSTCARLLADNGEYEKARVYLHRCLERRKRAAWNEEGVARAQFRYASVLEKLGEESEAEKQRTAARKTRERFMKEYPAYLPATDDDEAVFDQMVSIWAGRFTGKLRQVALASPKGPGLEISMESMQVSGGS